ncbi:MAG: hypothetical protein GX351_01460 [Peptococcaceae bacterium]|nr:hypothetical protein [Peptococcaceae bacterium]
MRINGNSTFTTLVSSSNLLNIKEGQRYFIEIIETAQNNEGAIILNGKKINVKFETDVQMGDKFWVTGVVEDDKIVLKKDRVEPSKLSIQTKLDSFLSRGLNNSTEISKYLIDFINQTTSLNNILNSRNSQLSSLISLLWAIIPKWSEVRKNGNNFLEDFYKKLGLELEKSIYEYIFQSRTRNSFTSDSVKLQLLYLLAQKQSSLDQAENDMLAKLLNEITGQQLWIQSGDKENAYILLHLPLQDNGILYNCKIAIEGKRKGQKIDVDFSHIALEIETENLGVIGVDLLIYRDSVNVKLLNDKLNDRLINNFDSLKYKVEESFKKLGYNLKHFTIDSFNSFTQFEKFISGNSMLGVDIKR